jgi:uncharacterized protein (TIGR02996 family)
VTVTTTITAMLRAVRESPESMADDTLRLALADCLEENAGAVCWNCKGKGKVSVEFSRVPPTHADVECGICSGSGVGEESNGFAEWAELIRVQCELARGEPCESVGKWAKCNKVPECRNCALRRRSDALLAEHEARWRRGPACERCGGKAGIAWSESNMRYERLPWLCPACHGSGWTGPLGEKVLPDGHMMPRAWRVPADFRRGFIHRIQTPIADVFTPAGDVTDWAKRVAAWPCVALEEWGLTDRDPHEAGGKWTFWHDGGDPVLDTMREGIPAEQIIPSWLWFEMGLPWGWHDTEAAARSALARATARVVREAAHD